MTEQEAKKAFSEMKAQGADDQEILGTLYLMFQEDKLDINQLEALINVLGYEFSDEFKAMSPEDQKVKGFKEKDENEKAEGVTDKEVEEAKEVETENEDGGKEEKEEKTKETVKEETEDEEDEEEQARKLFGFDK